MDVRQKSPRVCADCGGSMADEPPRKKFCTACRDRRDRERRSRCQEKKRAEWLSQDQVCTRCSKIFRGPGPARFCPTCRRLEMGPRKRPRPDNSTHPGTRRADGVIILPPASARGRYTPKKPTPPPKGTKPGSLADIDYRLGMINYKRHAAGLQPLSYGQYVSILAQKDAKRVLHSGAK